MYHRDYDNIQMIEQLRQLMTLDANMNTSDIEERFEQIAKVLFECFESS